MQRLFPTEGEGVTADFPNLEAILGKIGDDDNFEPDDVQELIGAIKEATVLAAMAVAEAMGRLTLLSDLLGYFADPEAGDEVDAGEMLDVGLEPPAIDGPVADTA